MPAGTPTPMLIVAPRLTIQAADWSVAASKVRLVPESVSGDISTYSNPGGEEEAYVTWMFEADLKQSYGTDSTWTDLSALVGTVVTVEVAPADAVASGSNPIATVTFKMPHVPFIDADLGNATEWTLSSKVRGAPVFATS